ncbi:hypothetical protein M514_11553, partial [Trichuris suis]
WLFSVKPWTLPCLCLQTLSMRDQREATEAMVHLYTARTAATAIYWLLRGDGVFFCRKIATCLKNKRKFCSSNRTNRVRVRRLKRPN